MDENRQYHHVSDEQIKRILNRLAELGYKIDLKKMKDGNIPKPDILGRKGCEKSYIIERGNFWETRAVFNCGYHPNHVCLKVVINNGKGLALKAIYQNEYTKQLFDQFVELFKADQKMILKRLESRS